MVAYEVNSVGWTLVIKVWSVESQVVRAHWDCYPERDVAIVADASAGGPLPGQDPLGGTIAWVVVGTLIEHQNLPLISVRSLLCILDTEAIGASWSLPKLWNIGHYHSCNPFSLAYWMQSTQGLHMLNWFSVKLSMLFYLIQRLFFFFFGGGVWIQGINVTSVYDPLKKWDSLLCRDSITTSICSMIFICPCVVIKYDCKYVSVRVSLYIFCCIFQIK